MRAGDPVGVLCHNSVGLVEVMIAVVTLGARAVLINTGLAATQLEAVVERQGVKLLFHDEDLRSLVTTTTVPRISVDSGLAELSALAPDDDLRPPEQAGSVVVLTSGTTGTPKGARRRNPDNWRRWPWSSRGSR